MIDTNTIKDRILSFAYQGRLVESNKLSNDAIEAIQESIKGYIPVSEEEYLIDIPKEWKWTRLGYVTSNHGQITPSEAFSYIDVGTLDNVNHRLSSHENIVEAKDAPSRAKKVVETGDVIYSTVRPYLHNICIIDKDFPCTPIASTAFCVMHANEEILDNKYLFYWLLTKEFDKYSNGDPSKGALYPAIGEKDLLRGVIPLPAISEQKAIVEKIETVFEILDKINVLQNQYDSNQEALKSKLIDAAIQGKLTEQVSEGGSAADLLRKLSEGRTELVKQGEIRKKKVLPALSQTEYPFDIPHNWEWVHVSDIWAIINGDRGKNYPAKSTLSHTGIPFISALNLDGATVVADEKLLCLSDEQYEKLGSGKLKKGDVVVCIRGSIGKHGKYPFDRGAIASSLIIARNYLQNELINDYLMIYLDSQLFRDEIKKYNGGSAQPNLAAESLEKFRIPLPPVEEQEKIVNRVRKLLKTIAE